VVKPIAATPVTGNRSSAFTGSESPGDRHRNQDEHDHERSDQAREADPSEHIENLPVPPVELRAPKRHIEVVGNRSEVAVDGGPRTRFDLHLQILDPVGRHPEGNKAFVDMPCLDSTVSKSLQQYIGIRRCGAAFHRGKKMDGFARNRRHSGKDFTNRFLDALQKFGSIIADIIFRSRHLKGQYTVGRQSCCRVLKTLDAIETIQLRRLWVG
jgi:hypothetical protein